jgi:GNAT superfamily N-acetyltransferase
MKCVFRKIEGSEIKAAYSIIVGRTNWLNEQGIPQWPMPIPESIIVSRQQAGNFFGFWKGDELMAVVCLLEKNVSDWGNSLHGKYLYMATLTSDVRNKGKHYGQQCAIAAYQYAKENGYERMYLDCVDNQGRLPEFYAQLGFEIIDKKTAPDGRVDILMVKNL